MIYSYTGTLTAIKKNKAELCISTQKNLKHLIQKTQFSEEYIAYSLHLLKSSKSSRTAKKVNTCQDRKLRKYD